MVSNFKVNITMSRKLLKILESRGTFYKETYCGVTWQLRPFEPQSCHFWLGGEIPQFCFYYWLCFRQFKSIVKENWKGSRLARSLCMKNVSFLLQRGSSSNELRYLGNMLSNKHITWTKFSHWAYYFLGCILIYTSHLRIIKKGYVQRRGRVCSRR